VSERLSGKLAVVTGAAGGIGGAAAKALRSEGARIAAMDLKGLDIGPDDMSSEVDVTDEIQVSQAFHEIGLRIGVPDILVNCAGVQLLDRDSQVDSLELETWQRTIAVNLTGTFLCSKHALALMLPNGRGSIINIGSPTGITGRGWRYHAYSASKGGVQALTRAMAVAYGSRGIRVNCVVPGTIETGMTAALLHDPIRVEELVKRTALGRLGRPDDLAGVVVFLASSESSYVTGATYVVDGGLLVT
jgi:NAD(P)-dependent dehydrogenase (short-subunit alcohol dehydrogenase family)